MVDMEGVKGEFLGYNQVGGLFVGQDGELPQESKSVRTSTRLNGQIHSGKL